MLLSFTLHTLQGDRPIQVDVRRFVIAGWAGRDPAAIEHHIAELAAIGVPRPSTVPLFYRVAHHQLTQDPVVQVVGAHSAGEVEVLLFTHRGQACVGLTSDHTDRRLEAHSVALSKQVCAKPVGTGAWPLADVLDHWDSLRIRATIVEDGREVVYQDGLLASLLPVTDLARRYAGAECLPEDTAMSCGTVAVTGGIRPAGEFAMWLEDERLGRRLEHRYRIETLPDVS